jgi:hypothetical protein
MDANAKNEQSEGLRYLLHPLSPTTFFEQYWEQKPLLLKRNDPAFYSKLFARKDVEGWFARAAGGATSPARPRKAAASDSLRELNDCVRRL